jgi:uncharacterized protein (DUF2141 family)
MALCMAMLSCLVTLVGVSAEGEAGSIRVLFHGCDNDQGVLLVQLASSASMFEGNGEGFREARVPIEGGEASWEFARIPPGRYAIRVFHDENQNGKLDQRWGIGPPKESFGFSNDVMGALGPPSFEDASFEHLAGGTKMAIELKRF